MKLLTWNCQGAFRKKYELIADLAPDLAVIQECEALDKLPWKQGRPPSSACWFGESTSKGVGVFSWSDLEFAPLADYLAVNVSSPNTPGLRSLQSRQALEGILAPVQAARMAAQTTLKRRVPVLVKLAPDLADSDLDGALEAVLACGMDGVIAANTSLRRDGLRSAQASEAGGLSGAPLGEYSLSFLRKVVQRLDGRLPVIASGGVMDAAGARQRLQAGAVLVQLYTGLIYAGPGLVKTILEANR